MDKKIDLSIFQHDSLEVESMLAICGGSTGDYSGTVTVVQQATTEMQTRNLVM